jgi:hypothetical protein
MRAAYVEEGAREGARVLWSNTGFSSPRRSKESAMGNKIVTEADRKATPRPVVANGAVLPTPGRGQRRSLERGTATRSKKNPGKRPHSG